jgi:hypothetical protein
MLFYGMDGAFCNALQALNLCFIRLLGQRSCVCWLSRLALRNLDVVLFSSLAVSRQNPCHWWPLFFVGYWQSKESNMITVWSPGFHFGRQDVKTWAKLIFLGVQTSQPQYHGQPHLSRDTVAFFDPARCNKNLPHSSCLGQMKSHA